MILVKNKIEERFDPPFAVFENVVGNYIVRPLSWGGIWNPDGKLVGGNSILSCPIKEDAEMICDTFNRFFGLLKENQELKHTIKINEKSRRKMQKNLMQKLDVKNKKIDRALDCIEAFENFVDYKDYDNKPEQELYDVVEILKGEDNECI